MARITIIFLPLLAFYSGCTSQCYGCYSTYRASSLDAAAAGGRATGTALGGRPVRARQVRAIGRPIYNFYLDELVAAILE